MPKRKLDEVSGPAPAPRPSSDTRKMSIHGTRLTQMFENGVLMIMRGLKTSRGFERQKLSRREKTAKAQKDDKALERLKEEIETLKVCSYCYGIWLCGGYSSINSIANIWFNRVSITMPHPNDTCSSSLSGRSGLQKRGRSGSSRQSKRSPRKGRRVQRKRIS
jgi:hypothetical protein